MLFINLLFVKRRECSNAEGHDSARTRRVKEGIMGSRKLERLLDKHNRRRPRETRREPAKQKRKRKARARDGQKEEKRSHVENRSYSQ